MSARWHLLTGEYPPDAGGVSDATRELARALVRAGHEVHVWGAPATTVDDGVTVHDVGRGWGRVARLALADALDREPGRLLVQYAPRAFGAAGHNLAFCAWLRRRARRDAVRVVFHEPFFPFGWRLAHRAPTAAVNHAMAALLLRASPLAYVSTPSWAELLRPLAPRGTVFRHLPVGSTVPVGDAVHPGRAEIATPHVVIHFGTGARHVAPLVADAASTLLAARGDVTLVLVGRGVEVVASGLPPGRVVVAGPLPAAGISAWLRAADLALQPYADGASARRTTLLAALAHGVPVVTNRGAATGAEWTGAVELASNGQLALSVSALLDDAPRRRALGQAGAALYESRFSVERAVAVLAEDAGT